MKQLFGAQFKFVPVQPIVSGTKRIFGTPTDLVNGLNLSVLGNIVLHSSMQIIV